MGLIRKMTVYIPLITLVLITSVWVHESTHVLQHSHDNITEVCYFGRTESGAIGWVEYYPQDWKYDDSITQSNEDWARMFQMIYNILFDTSLLYFIILRDDWVP